MPYYIATIWRETPTLPGIRRLVVRAFAENPIVFRIEQEQRSKRLGWPDCSVGPISLSKDQTTHA